MPTLWQQLDSAYGTRAQLQAAVGALSPVRAVADVVVNHRCGALSDKVDFADPPFPDQAGAVCRDDECGVGTGDFDTGENQAAARDLDHTNAKVQTAIEQYLSDLKAAGFTGWRFDEVRGYRGDFVGLYNDRRNPTFPWASSGTPTGRRW